MNKRLIALLGVFALVVAFACPQALAFTPLVAEIDLSLLTTLLPTIVELMLTVAIIGILVRIMNKLGGIGGKS